PAGATYPLRSSEMNRWDRPIRVVMIVVGVYYLVFGFWAMLAPSSFFVQIATFAPFNTHFLHDAGAFQIGLGLALMLVVTMRDAVAAVALAVGIATLLHTIAHAVDSHLGGRPGRDITALALVSAVLLIVAALRLGAAASPDPADS